MRVVKFRLSPPTLCRTAGMKREAVLSVTNHLRAWFGFHPRFKWGKPYLGGLILALWLQPVWATTKNSGEAYRQALQFLSQQNWKAAAAEFEECLRTDPHNAAAYDGLSSSDSAWQTAGRREGVWAGGAHQPLRRACALLSGSAGCRFARCETRCQGAPDVPQAPAEKP